MHCWILFRVQTFLFLSKENLCLILIVDLRFILVPKHILSAHFEFLICIFCKQARIQRLIICSRDLIFGLIVYKKCFILSLNLFFTKTIFGINVNNLFSTLKTSNSEIFFFYNAPQKHESTLLHKYVLN